MCVVILFFQGLKFHADILSPNPVSCQLINQGKYDIEVCGEKKYWKEVERKFSNGFVKGQCENKLYPYFSMSMSVNKLVCKYNIELRKKSSKSSQKSLAWYRNEPSLDLLELKMSSNLANMTKRAKI